MLPCARCKYHPHPEEFTIEGERWKKYRPSFPQKCWVPTAPFEINVCLAQLSAKWMIYSTCFASLSFFLFMSWPLTGCRILNFDLFFKIIHKFLQGIILSLPVKLQMLHWGIRFTHSWLFTLITMSDFVTHWQYIQTIHPIVILTVCTIVVSCILNSIRELMQ